MEKITVTVELDAAALARVKAHAAQYGGSVDRLVCALLMGLGDASEGVEDRGVVGTTVDLAVRKIAVMASTAALADPGAVQGAQRPGSTLFDDHIVRVEKIMKILLEGEWLTAEQINDLQAEPPLDKRQPAAEWERTGRIYSVQFEDKVFFARYQFDAQIQPLPVVADILKVFAPAADSWQIAIWFHFPNGEGLVPRLALDDEATLWLAAINKAD